MVKNLIIKHNLSILFIQEIKSMPAQTFLHGGYNIFYINDDSRSEGTGIIINLDLFSINSITFINHQLTHTVAQNNKDFSYWNLISVYINPSKKNQELQDYILNYFSYENTIIGGDFNQLSKEVTKHALNHDLFFTQIYCKRKNRNIDKIISTSSIENESSDHETVTSDHSAIIVKIRFSPLELYNNKISIMRTSNRTIFDTSTLDIIEFRREVLSNLKTAENSKLRIVENWKTFWEDICKTANSYTNNPKKLWNLLKMITGKKKGKTLRGIFSDSKIITNKLKMTNIINNHYTIHFKNSTKYKSYLIEIQHTLRREDLAKAFQTYDSDSICKSFKTNSFGFDLLLPKNRMKTGGEEIIETVVKQITDYKMIPHIWKIGKLILLSKTDSAFPPLNKIRPIVIATLPLRI
jgi:hypothetical protein